MAKHLQTNLERVCNLTNSGLTGGGDFNLFCTAGIGDCDTCPVERSITANLIPDNTYRAVDEIISNGVVVPSADVIFKAGNLIRLQDGFKANQYFKATIECCPE